MPYGSFAYGSIEFAGQVEVTRTFTYTVDAVLTKQYTLTFTLDAAIIKTQSKTFTVDTAIIKTQSKTFTLNTVIFKANVSKTFTLDARIIMSEQDITFTIDALTSYKEQIYQMQADIADLKANGGGGTGDVVNGTLYSSDGIKNW